MTGESSNSPRRLSYGSGRRDDGGSSVARERDRGSDAYDREMGGRRDADDWTRGDNRRGVEDWIKGDHRDYSYEDRNGRNYEDARGDHRRGADDTTRGYQRDYGGRGDHVDTSSRGGTRGDSPCHSRQPATSYGQSDVYRQELERPMEHYHTEVPLRDTRFPLHGQSPSSDFSREDFTANPFRSDMTGAIGSSVYGTSQPSNAMRTPNLQMNSAQSVASGISIASAWHGEDIILVPKGHKASEVAVAATAAASLIADDVRSIYGFETAAASISNLVNPETNKESTLAVIKPAIIGQPHEGQSHIPMSYSTIKEGMKRELMITASLNATREISTSSPPINAYQFWTRCTLLVATAILKAGSQNIQIAHAASEIVMLHGIPSIHNEWLRTADQDLNLVSNAVRDGIANHTGGNESLASMVTIALVSEGSKVILMERIRSTALMETASQCIEKETLQHELRTGFQGTALPLHQSPSHSSRSTSTHGLSPVSKSRAPLAPQSRTRDESPHRSRNASFNEEQDQCDRAMTIPTLSLVPSESIVADVTNGEDVSRSAIRNAGSLLDVGSNDDDDSDNNANTLRSHMNANELQTPQKMAKSPSVIAQREYISATVNRILAGASPEDGKIRVGRKETSSETRKRLKNLELEKRREDIAARINNIQMRAAANRDMPGVLGNMGTIEAHHNDTSEKLDEGRSSKKNQQKSQHHDSARSATKVHDSPSFLNTSPSVLDSFLQRFNCDGGLDNEMEMQGEVDEWEAFRQSEVVNAPIGPSSPENWETLGSFEDNVSLIKIENDSIPMPKRGATTHYIEQSSGASNFNSYLNGPAIPNPADSNGAFADAFKNGGLSNAPTRRLSLGRS